MIGLFRPRCPTFGYAIPVELPRTNDGPAHFEKEPELAEKALGEEIHSVERKSFHSIERDGISY
jgi:hypothetical protein